MLFEDAFEQNKKLLKSHGFAYDQIQHWENDEKLEDAKLEVVPIVAVVKAALLELRPLCVAYMQNAAFNMGTVHETLYKHDQRLKAYLATLNEVAGSDLMPVIAIDLPIQKEKDPYILDVHIMRTDDALKKFYHM